MITYGQLTDRGRIRKSNEDAVYSQVITGSGAFSHPDVGMFIVADGEGGQPADEMADLLIQTVSNKLCRVLILPFIDNYIQLSDRYIEETLRAAFEEANQAIYNRFYDDSGLTWAGVSSTTAFILDTSLYLVHVGNTRAVLLKQNQVERLTNYHDVAQVLVEHGQFSSRDEAYTASPTADVLFSSFGGETLNRIDVSKHSLPDESAFVLCTGASNRYKNGLTESEIFAIMNESYHPQDACQRLVDAVNAKSGKDNISVILVSNNYPFKPLAAG